MTHTRGRKKGQSTAVLNPERLMPHDFAYLRAIIEGIDPHVAGKRYLGLQRVDLRVLTTEFKKRLRLAKRLLLALHDTDATASEKSSAQEIAKAQKVLDLLRLRDLPIPARAEAQQKPAVSFEEFSEEFGFAYTHDELVEQYELHHGPVLGQRSDAVEVGARHEAETRLHQQLASLNDLQMRLYAAPKGSDPAAQWLTARLSHKLHLLGVLTLDDCVAAINLGGRTWYRCLPGVGAKQAGALVQWLQEHEAHWSQPLHPRVHTGLSTSGRVAQRAVGGGASPVVRAVNHMAEDVAQEALALGGRAQSMFVQPTMAGAHLSLRTQGPNALGAEHDGQAYASWCKVMDLKSAATARAYTRDVNRLLWWAKEHGKALSELTVDDAVAHVQFLRNPPAHWVNALRPAQSDADWRPMRGPLSTVSIQRALGAIQNFYGFLQQTHYLAANPFAQIPVQHMRGRSESIKSLSDQHLKAIEQALLDMPPGPVRTRLRAILALLGLGLRRSEFTAARWGHLYQEDGYWVLKVTGKGMRERLIPVPEEVVKALQLHCHDRQSLEASGAVPRVDQPGHRALVCALEVVNGQVSDASGALSGDALHDALKRLFSKAGRHGDQRLAKASAHWMRHTFAKQLLKATGNDLAVTQKLLGHASIATTGIYVEADLTDRVEAIRKLRRSRGG